MACIWKPTQPNTFHLAEASLKSKRNSGLVNCSGKTQRFSQFRESKVLGAPKPDHGLYRIGEHPTHRNPFDPGFGPPFIRATEALTPTIPLVPISSTPLGIVAVHRLEQIRFGDDPQQRVPVVGMPEQNAGPALQQAIAHTFPPTAGLRFQG